MTTPPTDSGGPGLRPPDPPEAGRSLATSGSPRTKAGLAAPTVQPDNLCGPPEVEPGRPPQSDPFPALMTTPSDAQGGKGSTERTTTSGLTTEVQSATVQSRTGAKPLGSYAAAVQHGRTQGRRDKANPPTTIAGTWSPRERKLLLSTLAHDWEASSAPVDTPEQALFRTVALATSKVHANNALRDRSKQETDTLLQYLDKTLERPHPPNFAKATLPLLQRAMLEQFHEKHCEVMLTADISPRAQLRRSMTHNSIFAQLHAANGDSAAGRSMLARLLDDVKRLHFDGLHTLTFVFNSERIAQMYLGLAFRLNGTCIELEDTTDDPDSGTYRQARLRRQYSVRAYGVDDLGLVVLLAALGRLNGVDVVDAERSRVGASEIVDNSYFLLRFNTDTCPDMLRGVTKLTIHGRLITLHHHVIYQRLPCTRCYAPYHTTGFCKAKPGQVLTQQAKFLRTYKGPLPSYQVGTATQYRHTDEESLTTFLTTLHHELTGETVVAGEGATPPPVAELLRTENKPDQTHSPATHPTASARAPADAVSGTTVAATPAETITDGFTVVTHRQRRNGNGEVRTTAEQGPGSGSAAGNTAGAPRTGATPAAAHSGTNPRAAPPTRRAFIPKAQTGTPAGATTRPKAKSKASAYAKFKQDHAMDEAPYAYPPPSPENATEAIEELRTSLHKGGSTTLRLAGYAETTGSSQSPPATDEVQLRDDGTVLSSYLGSSPPSSPRSPATTPGSSAPFSLVSGQDLSPSPMEVDTHEPEAEEDGTGDPTEDRAETGVAAGSSPSQDGFRIERVRLAPGMPPQLPSFLLPFQGQSGLVNV
uniref:Uncharacterized protein n=1 Tax=Phytophthora fragariae TaxID=53985 RepID=A0A6A3EDC5_9STRA|nr:hypothetical protein PF009_g19343 [Phytophthora fragariae]